MENHFQPAVIPTRPLHSTPRWRCICIPDISAAARVSFRVGQPRMMGEFMQSVEDFMRQYFDERIVDEEREQASRVPFRRKFHTDDCYWDSRAGQIEMMRSERVLSISSSHTEAEVVTTRHFSALSGSVQQLRYHLKARGGRWLIREVDTWCLSCHGVPGNRSCRFCQGAGWRVLKHRTEG